jgi:serine/threonine-protein phosphatase 2B regulatory subunit
MLTQYDIEEVQDHCNHVCESLTNRRLILLRWAYLLWSDLISSHAFRRWELVSQQEIVSLYHRFCQLDRNGGGFISADEFMSVPEFAVNPLSQVKPLMLTSLHLPFPYIPSVF